MKKLIALMLLVSGLAFGITGPKVWQVPSGSTLPSWGTVPYGALPTNFQTSGSITSTGATATCSSYDDLTPSVSVTITTHGRPVWVGLVPSGTSGSQAAYARHSLSSGSISNLNGQINILRGSSVIAPISYLVVTNGTVSSPYQAWLDVSRVQTWDQPSAGTYTYKLQGCKSATVFELNYIQLVAIEMP